MVSIPQWTLVAIKRDRVTEWRICVGRNEEGEWMKGGRQMAAWCAVAVWCLIQVWVKWRMVSCCGRTFHWRRVEYIIAHKLDFWLHKHSTFIGDGCNSAQWKREWRQSLEYCLATANMSKKEQVCYVLSCCTSPVNRYKPFLRLTKTGKQFWHGNCKT